MANGKRHHIIKREIKKKKSFKRLYGSKKLVSVAEALLFVAECSGFGGSQKQSASTYFTA